jgi:hypothetical protein
VDEASVRALAGALREAEEVDLAPDRALTALRTAGLLV